MTRNGVRLYRNTRDTGDLIMRRSLLAYLPICLCLSATVAVAECTRDAAPAIPDGSAATLEDMQAAQQAMKAYMASSNAYLECLDKEGAAAGETEAEDARAARVANYNTAVDEQTAVADGFNAAVKAFKARN